MKPADVLTLFGFAFVVAGVAAIHWPSALIVGGAVLLLGAHKAVNGDVPTLTNQVPDKTKEGKA